MLKRLSLFFVFILTFTSTISLVPADLVNAESNYAEDLFISEYIEGSSNNKAIEIFNGTGADVELSNYSLELYSNGSDTVSNTVTLSGTLSNGNVYVLANSSAAQEILDVANTTNNSVINFNGDDAVVLKNNGEIIDVFGKIGEDPGSSWGSEENTTKDHTLVRKSSILSGDKNGADDFDPAIEWDSYPKNTFTQLGTHTMDGFGGDDPVNPIEKVANVIAIPDSGEVEKGTNINLLTSTEEATIYYTLDGINPTVGSAVYGQQPIVINEDTTIKAFAAKDGLENSDISEFIYTIKKPAEFITIAEAIEKPEGTEVIVEGIVTTEQGSGSSKAFYMQDDEAGTLVYTSNDYGINRGDKVRVEGETKNYNGYKFEIDYVEVTLVESNVGEPSPKDISIEDLGESYEGQLVRFENVLIKEISTDNYNNAYIDVEAQGKEATVKLDSRTGYGYTDITYEVGDLINAIGVVENYSSDKYRILIRDLNDLTLGDLGPDTIPPTIVHTPVIEGNINEDITISATVTDDRVVELVNLYYREKGAESYNIVNMTKVENEYSYTILNTALTEEGIEYYIEASDGTNIVTEPENISEPYKIIISTADIYEPEVKNLTPASGTSTGENLRPEISAEYSDASGIDIDSVKLFLDNQDVTAQSNITESKISYVPDTDLTRGNHIVRLEISDNAQPQQTAIVEWNFYVGEKEYNFYFGQLHSHTNISDGQGSLEEAYAWARDKGKADFFAVTDHSNWFDNEKDTSNENVTDISESTSDEWKQMHEVADQFNKDGEFVAIAGFEMTWSGSTGGWGHINTFNTPWFASRSNSKMDLPAYYAHIAEDTDSISQLNHPGKTFGDFADFGYYSEVADNVVNLIEVGNGEGPIRGSGYFPSYEYYTRALDKGWHLAPSNNQDNHKGNWITSNEARTVILAQELTREDIFDAIRNYRVYSTEDRNLEIMYTVNGSVMGSILDEPNNLDITIEIHDPDDQDEIGKVSIISNGGGVVASKTFDDNEALWELELDPQYSYYYIRVDQADKDIAVTAPVWTSEVTPVGISKVEVSQDPQIVGKSIELSATVYNNSPSILNDVKVEFFKDSLEGEKIGEAIAGSIASGSTGVATIEWSSDNTGKYNIYAKTVISVDGVDKVFSGRVSVEFANSEDVTKVVLDMGHYNAYVSGDYAGKDSTLREIFKERKYMLVENHDELTTEDLENAQLLVITDPQSTDKSDYNLKKSLFTDLEVAAIKEYTDKGGALIICSKADYKDGTGEYSNGTQLNKILESIETNLRVNDDEVVDEVNNGGQTYRLYFDRYVSTKYNLTDNIPEGTTYSFYSGCSVILSDEGNDEAVDWLVKGHETTKTIDADNQGDNIPIEQGNVNVIGAEILPSGAKVIVAGTIFFSDFETASGDNMYSNRQITENILDWMIQSEEVELKTIAEVRADENKDGIPDNLGKKFAVEGRITAQSEAVTPKNAFFEVIYVQDETGGITVFGVSATPLPLGTKVRVSGIVDQYDGDTELSVENELKDITILDDTTVPVEPKLMSTGESMLEENEGWLVKIQGIVTRMTENSIYLNDGTGEARVYVNGYIGDGTGNSETLGKWDPSIEVGDTVSAIGLASEDPEGHRLRVRNTSEIVKIEKVDYSVSINAVTTSDINGNLDTEFEMDNVVLVNTEIKNETTEALTGTLIIKLVDSQDRTYAIGFMNGVKLEAGEIEVLSMGFNVSGVSKGNHTAKVYVWDNFTDRAPLSEVGTVEFTVK